MNEVRRGPVQRSGTQPAQHSGTQPAQHSGTQPAQRSGTQPADVQAAFCGALVDEWARGGVSDAVVAPGSRSTPLVIALDADPRIRVHVVLDERSAGFMALGMGLATGRPAVVATTSGTAAVELHPAVVEAHQAGVPLIAVTADRPPELHQVGAPQTVEQEGLFSGALRWAASPGVAEADTAPGWRSLGSRIVAEAVAGAGGPGPVHVNLAFREPLLGDAAQIKVPPGRPGGAPWHATTPAGGRVRLDPPADLVEMLASYAGRSGIVVAGAGCGDPAGLVAAAGALGWPVLADPRSGCRGAGAAAGDAGASAGPGVRGGASAAGVVGAADSLLRVPAIGNGWVPDIVVRAGAPWASKVVSQWLASLPAGVPQVLCDQWSSWPDPERMASHTVAVTGSELLDAAATARNSAGLEPLADSPWLRQWTAAEDSAQAIFEALLGAGGDLELSEPAVARALAGACPPGARLIASSSMPIRDVEWFAPSGCSAEVLSNRGANGIDGVLATAIGVAAGEPRPVVALLGDLAFLYDAGSLLWAGARELSLTVVVVDNGGGGIFSFLPQAGAVGQERFERYWGTPHGVDVLAVAGAYGIAGSRVESRADLEGVLAGVGKPGVSVAVVRSERAANVANHDRLNAAVAAAVPEALAGT